ncbi:ABC transporter permease [Paenarthrobacter ureafaciens]|uniref:ABC transporter permease n=2 Tax=Paenarthrobacter ureafaciens TaxID=37931 RepID=UPI0015B7F813|nr:ABC transporter permease [Paenarthrobacter ureafaciens]NWL25612.1 ABC transporter permease [Paenarthrobacter ureafaciens]BCW86250.1 nitrate ABC transporter permease [Arthrobacter sp. NicSoilE8]
MKARKQVLGLAGIAGFLLLSELSSRSGLVDSRFMPPASDIVGALMGNLVQHKFWIAAGQTMQAWAIGLAISLVLGVVLGFVIGSSTILRRLTNSTVEFLRPIPSVALIPLAVLLFGVKIESSLMLIIYASFWQIFIQVLYGVADVDNIAMQTARSYGLNSLARIRHVVFPTTLPYLMTGLRLATAVALILAVTAGLVIGSPGLGREIALAQSGGAVPEMYALAVATGLIGVGINIAMRKVERRVLSWHSSVRSEAIA